MKKLFALILAVMLVVSMATAASAKSTTTLTTTVPAATYTLNIPANQEIPFGTTQADIGNITVTDAAGFAVGKNLEVTVTYDSFSATGVSTQIPYELTLFAKAGRNDQHTYKETTEELPAGKALVFVGDYTGSVKETTEIQAEIATGYIGKTMAPVSCIRFKTLSEDWSKALAGEYTSTITFTAEVVVEE